MFKTPPVPEPVHLDGFASGAVRGPLKVLRMILAKKGPL